MKLTEHFTLQEFERARKAQELGIDNHVPARAIPALEQLCQEVLEPLRLYAGEPVIISSGYRCPKLNRLVGGTLLSQHVKGEAADIRIPDRLTGMRWFAWLMENTTFDQLIWEHRRPSTCWIHVSCRKDLTLNRHQVLFLRK
jgi:hypothetical protein